MFIIGSPHHGVIIMSYFTIEGFHVISQTHYKTHLGVQMSTAKYASALYFSLLFCIDLLIVSVALSMAVKVDRAGRQGISPPTSSEGEKIDRQLSINISCCPCRHERKHENIMHTSSRKPPHHELRLSSCRGRLWILVTNYDSLFCRRRLNKIED